MFKWKKESKKLKEKEEQVNTCGVDGCCGGACADCPCQNGMSCNHDIDMAGGVCGCADDHAYDCACGICELDGAEGCGCEDCDGECECCSDRLGYDGTDVYAEIGEPIADFVVDVYHDDEIKKVFLSDFAGKWVVLFFYPADFTFVCPTELEELATMYKKFQGIDTEILAISTDTAYAHKAWHDISPAVSKVQFPMVSDASHELSEYFNVLIPDEGIARRGTFIINPEGVLISAEVNDNSIGRNAKEILRKVQAAQFVYEHGDKVCPAGWQPGDDGLEPGDELVGKI